MRNIVLVIGLIFGSYVFAQDVDHTARVTSKSKLLEAKSSGKFEFVLPAHLTRDEVDKNSSYYIHDFLVSFDQQSHLATISMVKNDERARKVVVRFLTACGVQNVELEGRSMDLYSFYERYLK